VEVDDFRTLAAAVDDGSGVRPSICSTGAFALELTSSKNSAIIPKAGVAP
jgi:hypothetical protein